MNSYLKITALFLVWFILFSVLMLSSCSKETSKPPVIEAQKNTLQETPSAPPAEPQAAAGDIVGLWDRTDGTYRLEIKSVPPSGFPDIAYFNPNPIVVGNSHVLFDKGTVSLFVELNDPAKGYNGCLYKLVYDKKNDQLAGTYYQAAMNQEYNIVFTRAQ